jgi:RND superfamily putative drug exporter
LWVVVLVVALGGSVAVGSAYSSSNSIPGTESQRAIDLLARDFPGHAGDSDQIVFHVRSGRVTAPAVRSRVEPMLAAVARVPHVSGVVSPYTAAGAGAISRDGRTAFATVNFDKSADAVPVSAINRVIHTARSIRSPGLEVGLGGEAISNAEGVSLSFATAIGLAAAIVVLLLTFGSMVAAGLPIVTALFGLGTTFGLIALASRAIKMPDASTELAAMIGLGVGIDYALFIVTRFRESAHRGNEVHAAIAEAFDTAGRAVFLAGLTVIVALLGMVALGVGFLSGLALSSAIGVLVMMLATLTLLPALLGVLGTRIARRRKTHPSSTTGSDRVLPPRASLWLRWGELVRRRPWPAALAGAAIMLLIAAPALSIRLGLADAGNNPPGTTTRTAYDLLAHGFGKGFNGPLLIVARLPHSGDQPALHTVQTTLQRAPGVTSVSPVQLSHDGRTAVYQVFPRSAPQATATTDLVNALRHKLLPPVARSTGTTLLVSGATAVGIDFASVLAGKLPLFIAIVVVLAAAMLFVVLSLTRDPTPGSGHERPLDRRRTRRHSPRLPARLARRPARGQPRADRTVAARDPVRSRVRSLNGLRGIPHLPRPRELAKDRRRLPVSRGRARVDRTRHHRSSHDHDLRIRLVRVRLRAHLQALRDQPRQRRIPRRIRHPHPAAARRPRATRPPHMAAAHVAEPTTTDSPPRE